MWDKIRAVWSRELLDTVRDKRTLYVMVLLPIILMPLMTTIGPLMMVRQMSSMEETVPVMSFVGGDDLALAELSGGLGELSGGMDSLPAWLDGSGRIAVESVAADAGPDEREALQQRLLDETLDLLVFVGGQAAVEQANTSGAGVGGSGAGGPDASGSEVSGSDVSESDVRRSDVSGSGVSGSHMSGFSVSGSHMSSSGVNGSDMAGSGVGGPDAGGSDVRRSDVSGSGVSGSYMSGSGVSGSHMSGSGVSGSDVIESGILGADGELTIPFEVVYNSDSQHSTMALQRFESLLDAYAEQIVEQRLLERGLSPAMLQPFEIAERRDVAPPVEIGAMMLGMFVPFFIVVWAVAGGMYTAIDAAAGEKERNSLESLVMAPVPAWVLAIGKFLAIATVTLFAVLLLIGSSSVSMLYIVPRLLGEGSALNAGLTFGGIALLFAVMALFVSLTSAIQLGMSVFSKTYREAQAYMSGLMFVVMLPAMYVMFLENVKVALWTYAVPILNVMLVAREIFDGSVNAAGVVVTCVSLAILAGLALWGTLRAFRQENIVFRT